MKKIPAIIIASIFVLVACSKKSDDNNNNNNGVDCSGPAKSFAADVTPVMQLSCAGCHGAGSTNGPGPLTNYTQIFNARTAIRDAVASGRMPQGGTLTTTQKNAILCWIDAGAPNN